MDKATIEQDRLLMLVHLRARLSAFVQHQLARLETVYEPPDELLTEIAQVKGEWKNLYALFDEVSDPRVIEHIIHQLLATEKRYNYLLQLAKEDQLHNYEIECR